jgi:hypothetical protein
MMFWRRLARLWRRWRHPRSIGDPEVLRLICAPQAPWPSWHPTKGPDGSMILQIVVELEVANRTDRDIRIVRAHLRDHGGSHAYFRLQCFGTERLEASGGCFLLDGEPTALQPFQIRRSRAQYVADLSCCVPLSSEFEAPVYPGIRPDHPDRPDRMAPCAWPWCVCRG